MNLQSIYELSENDGLLDAAIDYVYDSISDFRLESKFSEIDKVLEEMEVEKVPSVILVSFLTSTYTCSDQLPARSGYYLKVRETLIGRFGEERTNKILKGLQ